MELKRSIYKKLVEWKDQDTGRVLELEGARQVGKTYILRKFAAENFTHVVYINMAEPSGKHFLRCLAATTEWEIGKKPTERPLYEAVKLYDPEFKDEKKHIIIIDEIQESVETYNQIRTFARDFICYVIITGSYLGKTLQKDFFLPAGDIDRMVMEPLTFTEFLEVFEKQGLYMNTDLYGKSNPENYKKLQEYYEVYQRIGGYPAVVVSYAKYKDLDKCYQVIAELMEVFSNESKRYFTDIMDVNIFQKLFNAIALMMLKEKTGVRDLTDELSKIAYQNESGRLTKKMINSAISWLQESHIIGYASKSIDCNYTEIKDNSRYYFMDMGIAYHFLKITGSPYDNIKGLLAENFVYLALRRRINNSRQEIAGIAPWFALYQKTKGELDFYVRSLLDYKNYGIEVKSSDESFKTARVLLDNHKLDYLYVLRSDTKGGIAEDGKIKTVALYFADRITFDFGI